MTADTGARPEGRWAVLQHVAHEGPGLIADSLVTAGIPFEVVRLDHGDRLPGPGSIAGLVVMGGPMGVYDGSSHPWLPGERDLLTAVVVARKPVLGVCLGAQQLALALGAEVTTGARPEIGLGRVELTGPGRWDPVVGPEYGGLSDTTVPCVHWHQDTFSLPDGAVHLAASVPSRTRPSGGVTGPTGSSSMSRSTAPWSRAGSRTCPPGSPWIGCSWPKSRPWGVACSVDSSSTH